MLSKKVYFSAPHTFDTGFFAAAVYKKNHIFPSFKSKINILLKYY
jgi:hypothetical protein